MSEDGERRVIVNDQRDQMMARMIERVDMLRQQYEQNQRSMTDWMRSLENTSNKLSEAVIRLDTTVANLSKSSDRIDKAENRLNAIEMRNVLADADLKSWRSFRSAMWKWMTGVIGTAVTAGIAAAVYVKGH